MKRLTSFLLVLTLLLSMVPTVLAARETQSKTSVPEGSDHSAPAGNPQPAKLLIDQVYGGGGKGETPISNSFIELYNPGSEAVELAGYTLQMGDKALELTGVIPANGSYLVVGAAESTTDAFLTCDLPTADLTCDWVISNKNYTVKLMNGDAEVDSVTADENVAAVKVSKQKSLRRVNHADTDTNDDFQVIVWEKTSVTVDEAYVTAYAPHNSKGELGKVHGAASEPEYTPVVAGDTRVTGYYDETGSLKLELAGRHNSGAMNADGGSLEIVQYNPVNGFAYAVSGVKGKLIAVNLNGSLDGETVAELTGTEYDLKSGVLVEGFTYGDMTSVAVSPDGTKLAVAIQAEDYAANGVAAVFACKANGSLELLSAATVGVQPDMVTFASNDTILTADEGEPRNGVNGVDPKGSVTIVTIGKDHTLSANTVYFDQFDAQREALTAAGVLVQKGAQPSADFEPEYIAVSGGTAYVSLQEANAIAVLDIASSAFTGVYPLGFQDYSKTKVDLQKNDAILLENYENVYGIKMPDGISVTTIGGKTYLLTANEGDSRADWEGLDNEAEGKTSPTGNVTLDAKVVWFNANLWDGLDAEKAYVFGGRSFSIYEATDEGLTLVYDSGSDFEEITAEQLPDYFNASNDKMSLDNRSGKKGPEPESVVTGTVDGKTYAFIALERIGGVMVYDITDPAQATFVNYINSREFEAAIQGDVSPEGLCFIPSADRASGKALLLAACEVSGTLAVYEMEGQPAPEYAITIEAAAHGSVTSNHESASAGTAVTLTALPDKGYILETLTVVDADGNEIRLTGENGVYTFTMPAGQVVVRAAFLMSNVFEDVPSDAYYYDAVLWAAGKGITTGTSATAFSPDDACTRAQAVTFLWRAAGSPAPESSISPFTDVQPGSYYYDAVLWAFENGITKGTGSTTFSPEMKCTRSQAITFLWRSQGSPAAGDANCFADVAADAYYADAVRWAVENQITNGTSANTFSPDCDCTRAQIVTFLYRSRNG
ncbi:MAG: choice-of-anchor I family protein [Faecousia sp.]